MSTGELPEPYYNDNSLIEQIFNKEFIDHASIPYDLNFEIIPEYIPINEPSLKPDHIIKVLRDENNKIISILKLLEENNKELLKIRDFKNSETALKKLVSLVEKIIQSEATHQKKESVLFPELEKRGAVGAIYLLRIENEELRKYIRILNSILLNISHSNYPDSRKKINALVKLISLKLQEHVDKENFIIFPLALKIIKEAAAWQKVKSECLNIKG